MLNIKRLNVPIIINVMERVHGSLSSLSCRREAWGFVVIRCFSNVVLQCVAIPLCGVAVISKPLVYDVCVFHSTVFIEMKFFAVLWFLVWPFSNLRSEIKETELSGWANSWKDCFITWQQ